MALTNQTKPTASLTNQAFGEAGQTWGDQGDATWGDKAGTWGRQVTEVSNATLPTASLTNEAKP